MPMTAAPNKNAAKSLHKLTGISLKRERERLREGGSVVKVVVAVHHRRLEDGGEERTQRNKKTKRNSWHFTAASQWQRKKSCLPTYRK